VALKKIGFKAYLSFAVAVYHRHLFLASRHFCCKPATNNGIFYLFSLTIPLISCFSNLLRKCNKKVLLINFIVYHEFSKSFWILRDIKQMNP